MPARGSKNGAGARFTAASSSAADAAASSSAADATASSSAAHTADGLHIIVYNIGITKDDWGSKKKWRWDDVARDFGLLLRSPLPHTVLLQECGPYGRVVSKVASDGKHK